MFPLVLSSTDQPGCLSRSWKCSLLSGISWVSSVHLKVSCFCYFIQWAENWLLVSSPLFHGGFSQRLLSPPWEAPAAANNYVCLPDFVLVKNHFRIMLMIKLVRKERLFSLKISLAVTATDVHGINTDCFLCGCSCDFTLIRPVKLILFSSNLHLWANQSGAITSLVPIFSYFLLLWCKTAGLISDRSVLL